MKRPEQILINLLKEKKLTIAFAESITCGLATHKLGTVSGTSDVLMGSIICYNEKVKTALLGISNQMLKKYTAESQEVTNMLAKNLQKVIKADVYAAITGLAASGGSETKNKPVGTTFFAVRIKGKLYSRKKCFHGRPLDIKKKACNELYRFIVKELRNTLRK